MCIHSSSNMLRPKQPFRSEIIMAPVSIWQGSVHASLIAYAALYNLHQISPMALVISTQQIHHVRPTAAGAVFGGPCGATLLGAGGTPIATAVIS